MNSANKYILIGQKHTLKFSANKTELHCRVLQFFRFILQDLGALLLVFIRAFFVGEVIQNFGAGNNVKDCVHLNDFGNAGRITRTSGEEACALLFGHRGGEPGSQTNRLGSAVVVHHKSQAGACPSANCRPKTFGLLARHFPHQDRNLL